ncbi:cupin domain-containing protein [Bailinhaonella thermotolerans]|uniref:Cupin domain-containing protein n=2 Tax=Bailinhaonella thermotolerans TaxID=1070861 RepID=A0A3A4B7T0_9ACTN|nr:cupin domain-containing protein [Bailinhaonella thermotolerans]
MPLQSWLDRDPHAEAVRADDDDAAMVLAAGADGPVVVLTVDEEVRLPLSEAVTRVRYVRRDGAGRVLALHERGATAEALDLLPHPDGGWHRETWTAPADAPAGRPAAAASYFLLEPGEEAAWRRSPAEELWLWHRGAPVALLLGGRAEGPADAPETVVLGPDIAAGHRPQALVPAATWHAAHPAIAEESLLTRVATPR